VKPQGGRLAPLGPAGAAAGAPAAPADAAATKQPAGVSDAAVGLERLLLLTDFGAGATAAEFDAVAARALALVGAKDSRGRAPGEAEFMRPLLTPMMTVLETHILRGLPANLVLGEVDALDGAIAAGLLGRLTDTTPLTGKPSLFMRWWMEGAAGGTARILAGALLTHAGREEVAEVCGPFHTMTIAQLGAGLERLLLTDLGAGATAAEFDAVAVRALALMGAKDSGGNAQGDAEFMRPVKDDWGNMKPAKLVLGAPEALDGAIAAGLLERLTDTTGLAGKPSPFMRWWVEGAAGGTARILAGALLTHAGREEVAEVCGSSHKMMVAQLASELERLLLTDVGAGATAAEFDAVAVRALALMGAKDSGGRAPADAEFMRRVIGVI
jgi:hypothetical protein